METAGSDAGGVLDLGAPRRMGAPSRPLPPEVSGTCELFRGALSAAECRQLIAWAEATGYQSASPAYPPSYRNNDRLVRDDPALAQALFARLRPCLPPTLTAPDGSLWRLVGLNERFRFCRYRPGQRFSIHRDGVHHRSEAEKSMLTFMVYLNGQKDFEGGTTRFFADRDDAAPPLCRLSPETGALIVFDHALWHDGEEVRKGLKYILRSDILYARASPAPRAPEGHLGYLWTVLERADGTLVTASRDKTLRLWRRRGEALEPIGVWHGHENSVTALCEGAAGTLWSGSRDRTVRVWSEAGECARVLEGHEGAVLALAPCGDSGVASGSADGTIRLWSEDGRCTRVLRGHKGWVWALLPGAPGALLSGSEDGTIRRWDLRSGASEVVGAPGAPIRALARLRGSDTFASGGVDGAVWCWSGGGEARRLMGHTGAVRALAALPDGRLASGAEDDTLRVWNPRDGTCAPPLRHADFVTSLTVLRDGPLASTSYDGTLRFWNPG